MSATVMLILVMLMLVSMGNWKQHTRNAYRCGQCGTKRQDKHSEDCAWKRGK